MSITLIRSRRRLINNNSYNSPHYRKNKKLLANSQAERAQRNRDKKRAQLDKLKNKNKPKSKRPKDPRCLIGLNIINSKIINLKNSLKN